MSFQADVHRFAMTLEERQRQLLPYVAGTVYDSIVFGSALTGAPGQTVDEGHLRGSWQLTFPSATEALVATASPYALENEDGVRADGRPYIQRSPVGGRHSVKLTEHSFDRIVANAAMSIGAA